jgi:hypothetical protein
MVRPPVILDVDPSLTQKTSMCNCSHAMILQIISVSRVFPAPQTTPFDLLRLCAQLIATL